MSDVARVYITGQIHRFLLLAHVSGPDQVPQMRELGPAPRGQAGPGASREVEADGCGGLPGAAVVTVHQPHGQTLRRGAATAGG